jgi:hypothetical protein
MAASARGKAGGGLDQTGRPVNWMAGKNVFEPTAASAIRLWPADYPTS